MKGSIVSIVMSILMLLTVGAVMALSIESQWREGMGGLASPPKLILYQLKWGAAGIVCMAILGNSNYRHARDLTVMVFIFIVVLLMLASTGAFIIRHRPAALA